MIAHLADLAGIIRRSSWPSCRPRSRCFSGGDGVAIAVLLGSGLVRLGPARELFQGVSEPVVITVISGLIFGSGMQSSGAVDALARVAATSGLASGRAARH